MAKKIKVAGYSKKTFFDGGIEYRNFNPDLVGTQLASNGGTTLFTMGNFAITTNLDPKLSKNFVTSNFSQFLSLDDLKLTVEQTNELIKNNTATLLNLDKTKLKNYALFGSMTEYIRVTLEDIITNWPASLYANKFALIDGTNYVGNTYEDYVYDSLTDVSTFKVNVTFLKNQYQINFLTNGTIIDTFNESNDLRNLTINYESYCIYVNGKEYNITGFVGASYSTNDYIYLTVKGQPFDTTSTYSNISYHIKPNKTIVDKYFNGLRDLKKYLLNRESTPLYTATFTYPVKSDNGIIFYTETSVTWPVTDGYNIDFDTDKYVDYVNGLLVIASNYDNNETNLMNRFLVSESISSFDTVPVHLAPEHEDTTTGQKVNKTLNIYGRSFDDLNQFIEGISFAHSVSYDKNNNVPDKYLKDLAKILGWELVSTILEDDLVKNLTESSDSSFSGVSTGLTPIEKDYEMWRRIILNSPWLWKSKGARKSVEFILNLLGIPKGLVTFDEHIYRAKGPIDINLFLDVLEKNDLDTDLSLYPIDINGYPNPLRNTDSMYFQNDGLWYRQTGGSGATIDITTGNNPHAGPYDGGFKYINQFRALIPNFSAVTITSTTVSRIEKNLFSNYSKGEITSYSGDTYVDVLALDNTDISDCVVYQAEIINDPMPTKPISACGCEFEGDDDALSICVKKGQTSTKACDGLVGERTIDPKTGFYVVNKPVYDINKTVVGTTKTTFIKKDCCKLLGGVSSFMNSQYSGGYAGNKLVKTSGYVCCTTNKCGCNTACDWGINMYDKTNNIFTVLQPIEMPAGSNNYMLQFVDDNGYGDKKMVTVDGSNCPPDYTIPVNGVKDPFTGEYGFGCKLTSLGLKDIALGDKGRLFRLFVSRQNKIIGCCDTYKTALYE